ncbi:recombination-related endonuclease [Synechococcus phage S-B68]|nr:recombination-related endonuclease [Synechococcus phage S-B68]
MPRKKTSKKVALITDTHYGMRKGSQIFHDAFEKFYSETFFPTLDERGIDTVIHLGDVFDVRKGIDYWSLDWAKRVVFRPLLDRGIDTHIIVGNHDIFYKQSLKINSPGLNLTEFSNVQTYSSPQTVKIKGKEVFVIPWVCEENAEEFVEMRDQSKAKVAMGHLEIAGFYANSTYQVQHGLDMGIFSQFDQVFSGHYHKKNSSGNITYLGNPYQMYWNDEGDTRGFHIFDLETHELEFIANPNVMFNKIYYNESKQKLINPNRYKNSYVKLIVEGKSTPNRLTALIDKLYKVGIHDLKVIENYELSVDDDVEVEAEDTLTTLTNYVNAMDAEINKENLIDIFKSLYVEAQEV